MLNSREFTSEWVSSGHPDKIADQISDALLDEYLRRNSSCRVAVETLVTYRKIIIAGEVSHMLLTDSEIKQTVLSVIHSLGYAPDLLDADNIAIEIILHNQSTEISDCIHQGAVNQGAGDQGMVFGFAVNETENFMPAPIYTAQKVMQYIFKASACGQTDFKLGPDAKSQATVIYKKNKPCAIGKLVVSIQHPVDTSVDDVKKNIMPVILSAIPSGWLSSLEDIIINPSGSFHMGGPKSDCGLTGRKTAVDTYGGHYHNGGGALSGKDPTKIDRSGTYFARYIAKNIVASGLAQICGVDIAYAIGMASPVSFSVKTFGTSGISDNEITSYIKSELKLTPYAIQQHLKLNKPIYAATAIKGHFGHDPESNGCYSWERIDWASKIAEEFKTKKIHVPNMLIRKPQYGIPNINNDSG